MAPPQFTRIVLNERPKTDIQPNTFRSTTVPYDSLKVGDKEVLIKVNYISLDPAARGWIKDERSYLPPVQIGEVMRAYGLGTVVQAGNGSEFKEGDSVIGTIGWQEYVVLADKDVKKVEAFPGVEMLDYLNILGFAGFTAYFGVKDIGQLKAGEVFVVSGAAGSVGMIACQLGKRIGAKVYAIAGSQDKCEWLEKELGVEKAFNYKSETFKEDFKKIGYLDVYFDNVGGDMLSMMLTRLKPKARIVLCGGISSYNLATPPAITGHLNLISQRGRMEGYIVSDYAARYPEAIQDMAQGIKDGSIKSKFHIVEGLDQAPSALPMLFSGGNTGKLLVKVSDGIKAKI
jgi:hypothetical protein